MRQSVSWIAVSLVAAIPAIASTPALPAGSEFQVNSYTAATQVGASVASDATGDFVIVWSSQGQDASGYGVFGQRFSSSGAPSGTEFQVNTWTAGVQGGLGSIEVSSAADGAFVVVWTRGGGDGDGDGVFARRYDDTGMPIGAEFQANVYTAGNQSNASVSSAPNGDFAVAWTDRSSRDGDGYGVFARRFDSSGASLGDDFQLNTYTPSLQGNFGPRLTFDAAGNFVAVWESRQDGAGPGSPGIFGRRFDGSGSALGTEFQVNTSTVVSQEFPSIASDPDGNFFVVWRSFQDGSACSVHAQRFDDIANRLGGEFQVNSYTFLCQAPFRQSVFADSSDRFVVVWTDQSYLDGSFFRIAGQQYAPDGSAIGSEFQVNSYTVYGQSFPAVAGTSSGDFVVAWQSYGEDGSYFGIFGQRFQAGVLTTDTPTPTPTETPTATPTATRLGDCPSSVDNGCTTGFAKGALLVKEDVAGKEKLIAKMVKGPALAQTDLGNPLDPGGTVYSLCIYDDAGNLAGGTSASVVVDRAGDTCGGSPCWTAVGSDPPGGKGYKYLDGALASDGVLKILYKGGTAGKSKLILKGKGPNLPDGIPAALQTTTFATVQFRASDGMCLSVAVDDVKKHTAGSFKAKFAAP